MKKIEHIFPNIVLLIGGRFLLLLGITLLPIMCVMLLSDYSIEALIAVIVVIVPLGACEIYVIRFLWHQCFGEIIVTEKAIIYFGFLLPIIKLEFEKIKYVDIITFDKGNVMYSKGNKQIDAYKFILLSEKPLPKRRIDEIRPSKKGRLIKYAVSEKLCKSLVDKLPQEQSVVDYQLMLYKKAK